MGVDGEAIGEAAIGQMGLLDSQLSYSVHHPSSDRSLLDVVADGMLQLHHHEQHQLVGFLGSDAGIVASIPADWAYEQLPLQKQRVWHKLGQAEADVSLLKPPHCCSLLCSLLLLWVGLHLLQQELLSQVMNHNPRLF